MQVYVIPRRDAAGQPMIVRQPFNSWLPLPDEGKWVEMDEYWARRIRDGDVLEGEPPADKPEENAPEGAPKMAPKAKHKDA